jgi:hypothetical protein
VLCAFYERLVRGKQSRGGDSFALLEDELHYFNRYHRNALDTLVGWGYLEHDDVPGRKYEYGRFVPPKKYRITPRGVDRIEQPAALIDLPDELDSVLRELRRLERRILRIGEPKK